jgi:hypothetical protein
LTQLLKACLCPRTRDVLVRAIEGQGVAVKGGATRGGGVCSEVVLR